MLLAAGAVVPRLGSGPRGPEELRTLETHVLTARWVQGQGQEAADSNLGSTVVGLVLYLRPLYLPQTQMPSEACLKIEVSVRRATRVS